MIPCICNKYSMMYSHKMIKCEFGFHAPGYCKVIDFEERMYDSKIGKVCCNCDRIMRSGSLIIPKHDN